MCVFPQHGPSMLPRYLWSVNAHEDVLGGVDSCYEAGRKYNSQAMPSGS